MSENRAARGRPKGTGLDDRSRLLAVAQLMARDPHLKATTAIKSTGVTDPSTIRRLRDKFQQIKDELITEMVPEKPAVNHTRSERTATLPALRTAAARAPSAPKKQSKPVQPKAEPAVHEAVAPAAASAVTARAPASAAAPHPAAWMAMWYGVGLQNLNTAVALQISFVEKIMRMPHVATALRGQVAFSKLTLALCPMPPSMPKTLH